MLLRKGLAAEIPVGKCIAIQRAQLLIVRIRLKNPTTTNQSQSQTKRRFSGGVYRTSDDGARNHEDTFHTSSEP